MKKTIEKYLILMTMLPALGLVMSASAQAGSINDSYVSGDKLTAEAMNNIKDAVNDNDQRVTSLETMGKQPPDFSGYGLPFSALGAPINVIVLKTDNGNGSVSYNVRTRYENNTDQVSVQGSLITPPFIANYGFVAVDAGGNITTISQGIEAPQTKNYLDYTIEDKNLDPANPSVTLSLNSDNIRDVWTCSGGGAISTCAVDTRVNNVSDSSVTPTAVYSALGPGTVNGMAFTDLRGEDRIYTSAHNYRVRARGIGTVLNLSPTGRPNVAIYYRVNGATDGSLAGTPFAPGQPMDGIWF